MIVTKLDNLNPHEYEHLLDRKALDALEGTPGLETLVKAFNKYGVEKLLKIQYTGSNLKITASNYPEIYQCLSDVCETLQLELIPDLYVQWGYQVNAFTAGVEKNIMVLYSGAIDLLTPDELAFVIGHEVGHIKSRHVLYHQMAEVLPVIGGIIGSATLGIGDLLSTGVQLALLNWQRMSEFTADRAGLLACQDIEAANRAMIKMAGVPYKHFDKINVQEFMKQAKEFEQYDFNALDKIAKIFSIMWQNHPWTVMRGAELLKWIESGTYDDVLARRTNAQTDVLLYCKNCGAVLQGNENYCGKCGYKLH